MSEHPNRIKIDPPEGQVFSVMFAQTSSDENTLTAFQLMRALVETGLVCLTIGDTQILSINLNESPEELGEQAIKIYTACSLTNLVINVAPYIIIQNWALDDLRNR